MTIILTFSDMHRYEPDGWSPEGDCLTTKGKLWTLQQLAGSGRFLVAQHWHYRGAREPDRILVEDYEDFIEYLKNNAIAGDIVDIHDLTDAWNERGNPTITGKCPDQKGEVPRTGAY